MSPPTVVVFDLGNVVVTWDRELLYRRLIPDAGERARFLDEVLTLEENAVLDRGTPLAEMTADLARRHPTHAALIEAFRTDWIDTIGPDVPGTVEIIDELRQGGVECYALSNWGRDTFEQAAPRLWWLDRFRGVVISGQEGVVKPDPEIFEILCRRHGFAPTDAVFVDDSAANVDAASALGFHALRFIDADRLREALVGFGLLPSRGAAS